MLGLGMEVIAAVVGDLAMVVVVLYGIKETSLRVWLQSTTARYISMLVMLQT